MIAAPDQIAAQIAGDGDPEDTSGQNSWLRIVQKEIPENQQIATVVDFNAGYRQLKAGYSAHTAITGICPVSYSTINGQRAVFCTVEFYVHRAESIDVEIEVTLGGELLDVQGPTQGLIPQGKAWIINKNKTQQLGWRPSQGLFRSRWEIAFDPKTGKRILNPALLPTVEQDDGFIYLAGDAVLGSLWVSGTADVDVYRVRVGQPVGTEWQGGLYASAYWPAGAERKFQQRVTEELFIPECVAEKMAECAKTIQDLLDQGVLPDELAGAPGAPTVVYPAISLDVDDCTGRVLGRTPNT